MPVAEFMAMIAARKIPRVPGTAVFLTRTERDVPPVMVWHVKHNRALHRARCSSLTVSTASVPWVAAADRLTFRRGRAAFLARRRPLRLHGTAGYPGIAARGARRGAARSTSPTSPITSATRRSCRAEDGKALPRWVEALFALMQRNSARLVDYFRLPRDAVVELGREISI